MKISKDVTVSGDLLHFLSDWLDWADRCGKSTEIFSPCEGLCGGLYSWLDKCYEGKNALHGELAREMKSAFKNSGLDRLYPFGEENFDDRISKCNQHKDPARRAWVKAVIHNTMRAAK